MPKHTAYPITLCNASTAIKMNGTRKMSSLRTCMLYCEKKNNYICIKEKVKMVQNLTPHPSEKYSCICNTKS